MTVTSFCSFNDQFSILLSFFIPFKVSATYIRVVNNNNEGLEGQLLFRID